MFQRKSEKLKDQQILLCVITAKTHLFAIRYAVRERAASGKYVRGKFPQPKNGKVIGHIINFKYVPWSKGKQKAKSESKESEPASKEVAASWDAEVLSYGAPAFAYRFCDDIISDLLEIYDAPDVYSIMVIAILRIIKPRISASRYASYYESSGQVRRQKA